MKSSTASKRLAWSKLFHAAMSDVFFRGRSVCVAALAFAIVMAASSTLIHAQIEREELRTATKFDVTPEELRTSFESWVKEASDQDILLSLLASNNQAPSQRDGEMDSRMFVDFALAAGRWSLLLFGVFACLLHASASYFLVFFSRESMTGFDALRALPRMFFSMIGLSIWVSIRSLLWIPLVGLLFGIYFFPRFALAPALLASGRETITGSVRSSLQATKGKWFSVMAVLVLLALLSVLLLWGAGILAATAFVFSPKAGNLVFLTGVFSLSAFVMALFTRLTVELR